MTARSLRTRLVCLLLVGVTTGLLPVAGAAPAASSSAGAAASTTAATTAAAPASAAHAAGPAAAVQTTAAGTLPLATTAPAAGTAPAATPTRATGAADTRSLDEQVQDLKKQTVELNRDLFVLEEELLFPANTQVAVFVSMDVGEFFALDSVQLKIDNKEVSNYLYTPREVSALLRGGVQRLYVGNLKSGPHELVAFFYGKGPNNRYYRRAAALKFDKGLGAKYLELQITDRQSAQEPEFQIKDWE